MNEQKGNLYQARCALNTDYYESMTFIPDSETRYRETEFRALSDRDAVIEAQKYVKELEKDRNYFNPRARLINLTKFSADSEGQVRKKEVPFKEFLTSARNVNPPNYLAFFSVDMGKPLGVLKRHCAFYESNDFNAYQNAEDHLLLDPPNNIFSNITKSEQKEMVKKMDEDKSTSLTLERLLRLEEVWLR